MVKILAFSGSARKDSYNQKLVEIAAGGARRTGVEVTLINLADFEMPIFNEDLEKKEGMPAAARDFKSLLIAHDGFLIASPEYNSAFSPLLKNAIDWASRREGDELPLLAYRGKLAAIMSASPGALGGLRGLVFLRLLLSNIGVTVQSGQQAIGNAAKAFNDDGSLVDSVQQDAVIELGVNLARTLAKLKSPE
ncbi:NADPH-dependent FMN reductase [Methylotuvimicrobium alcaliphilum]|uniref:NADPH-dependent FMN reductase n=1 Tax=Methylotuvimicrobium alcaliphilum (strain DSM 19304 / NCIMB 14124 / VKM B-2133 / 20Z) TaxID=1091494 RepID=G4T1Q6_META2|nr:NAD(P)H-dependent oxidoreductase [Methylotuvimicrobium alcaliphilum]CCE23488.1 NADPH-dependent FMN reductase [Methylotuvimicrobium alcaliphilum 20Z]